MRLGCEYIEPRTPNSPVLKSTHKVGLIDDTASSYVDQDTLWPKSVQHDLVDQTSCLDAARHADDRDVAVMG